MQLQPRGSLFEQTMVILFESIVLRIAELKGPGSDQMLSKHANPEQSNPHHPGLLPPRLIRSTL